MINRSNVTQDQIKAINKINVLSLVRENSPITKQEIAKRLQLSIPTVSTNITLLESEGLVQLGKMAASTGGRRPVTIDLIANSRYSIGVSIGIECVNFILMNLKGDTIYKKNVAFASGTPFSAIIDLITTIVPSIISNHNLEHHQILGIGLALPGMVDDEHNILLNAPNLKTKNYTFDQLEQTLGLPIFIENEANIAAFAEYALGFSKTIDNLVYISITDGVGCGIIISHHIYKGKTKRAGEFGHIRVSDRRIQCNCGRFGCWELFASNHAILRYYLEETNEIAKTIDDVFTAYQKGVNGAKKALETYSIYLKRGIENVLLALNPDCIVIGGQIAKYADIMQRYIDTIDDVPVRFSSLADEASLIGAAMIPFQEILSFSTVI